MNTATSGKCWMTNHSMPGQPGSNHGTTAAITIIRMAPRPLPVEALMPMAAIAIASISASCQIQPRCRPSDWVASQKATPKAR